MLSSERQRRPRIQPRKGSVLRVPDTRQPAPKSQLTLPCVCVCTCMWGCEYIHTCVSPCVLGVHPGQPLPEPRFPCWEARRAKHPPPPPRQQGRQHTRAPEAADPGPREGTTLVSSSSALSPASTSLPALLAWVGKTLKHRAWAGPRGPAGRASRPPVLSRSLTLLALASDDTRVHACAERTLRGLSRGTCLISKDLSEQPVYSGQCERGMERWKVNSKP